MINNMKKEKLIVITGPTSVGKTELSINLAKAINGEIISADSMQVYKRMDIGTAKIKKEEMDGVPHHLIDILEPEENFNIFMFKELADKAISDITKRGHVPIIVGGTGFYIQSVLKNVEFESEDNNSSNEIVKELEEIEKTKGALYLHNMLDDVDSEAAKQIHPNNVKRVIRALVFYKQTGNKISEHNESQAKKESPYDYMYFVINQDREILYKRIEDRIDIMIKDGLVEEVKKLMDIGLTKKNVSMQGLGYKEILDYLDGNIALEDAIEVLKRDTRHFAKRQLTWFRREKDVIWMNYPDYGCDKNIMLTKMVEMIGEHYGIKYNV